MAGHVKDTFGAYQRDGGAYKRSDGNPAFQMLVRTTNAGASNNDQFTIPLETGFTYNYDVDWGDGNVETGITSTADKTHTYAASGEYVIKITGAFPRIYFNNSGDDTKVLEIQNWGTQKWESFFRSFYGCSGMQLTAKDVPNLSLCSTLNAMFYGCVGLDADIRNWDITTITNMAFMLFNCNGFSVENYDKLLIGWEAQGPQTGVPFHGPTTYTPGGAAEAARTSLDTTYSWTITDGGPTP